MLTRFSRLIGSLTVGRKLALIYFLDLTTVLFISGILINEKYIAINFTKKEMIGNQFIAVVRDALLDVVERSAAAPAGPAISGTAPATIRHAEARFGAEMGSAALSSDFAAALATTAAAATVPAPEGATPIGIGRELLTRIGNQSNLILDPDLDSYYTMSLVVLHFPELLEVVDSMHRLAGKMATLPAARRQDQQTRFLVLEGRIDAILAGIESDYREAFSASSPALRARLVPGQVALASALRQFRIDSLRQAGLATSVGDAPSGAVVDAAGLPGAVIEVALAPVIVALRAAWTVSQSEMERLLQARNDEAFRRMGLHLGTALLLMALILTLIFLVARQIAIPIRRLAEVAGQVRGSGDYTLRANWDSSDEIGRLVTGFNSMLQQLDAQRLAQQNLVAQASAVLAQRALIEAIPLPLMVTSIPDHQVLHANDAARAWLGGHDRNPWQRGMEPAARARFFQCLSDTDAVDEFEVRWTAGDTPSWALVSARCLQYQGQAAVLTTFTPMNRMKQMESGLALWAKVFEASSESIVVMDQNGRVVTVNQAFRRGTAFEMHELLGKAPDLLLADRNPPDMMETVRHTTLVKGSWQGEIWLNRKNGQAYPAWLVINAARDINGAVTNFIAMSLDITERKASEQRIHYLAHHDALTGLPNRFSCDERMALSIQQARRRQTRVAVLFVDLDRFKNINDSLGHHIGDELLCSVAARLTNAVREGDTVSRLGGDEFVVILNNVVNAEEVGKIVDQRLIPAVRQPHLIDQAELYISCSIGAAIFPDDSDNIEGLMRHADAAMYQAKKLGRNNFQFFTPELNARVTRHLHLESDLRHAAERNELVLHYQPRIDAHSGRIAGVESLVRWQHPTEGLIGPAQFIPLAEESGLIVEMGAWIIRQACRQHQLWRAEGIGPMPISINLSALQLKDPGLVPILIEALAAHAVPAAQIELELTESLLMDNVAATIVVLNEIKALGFSLSIDDFGTGYSSLNYLHRFPIDKLKIDRSFIQNIHVAPENLAVTKAIIGLGHTLGLEVVAEGVEQVQDVQVLQEAGCDELQGFYFARPMPAEVFSNWLLGHRAEVA
ncbi:MAG: EAL domain-containing protein [Herminiimonas sp.]|nr:EAL domain-containing protein [Herminiimonas sp.]